MPGYARRHHKLLAKLQIIVIKQQSLASKNRGGTINIIGSDAMMQQTQRFR